MSQASLQPGVDMIDGAIAGDGTGGVARLSGRSVLVELHVSTGSLGYRCVEPMTVLMQVTDEMHTRRQLAEQQREEQHHVQERSVRHGASIARTWIHHRQAGERRSCSTSRMTCSDSDEGTSTAIMSGLRRSSQEIFVRPASVQICGDAHRR